jgi:hypothetical protein
MICIGRTIFFSSSARIDVHHVRIVFKCLLYVQYTPTALWPARDSLCLIWKNCSQKKRALFVKRLVETNKFSSCHFAFKFSALITRLWEHGFYQDHFQVQCFSMESMRTKIPQNLKCTTRRDILNHHSSAFIGNLQFLLNHTPG